MSNITTACPVCGQLLIVQNVRKEGQKTYIYCNRGHFSAWIDAEKWPETPENNQKNIEKR